MKIISGGQTGADKAALLAAKACGLETGGMAPRGYRTEKGHDSSLRGFGLTESPSADYDVRTRDNIQAADATLVLSSNQSSPGTKLTVRICRGKSKPFALVNPFDYDADVKIRTFIEKHRPAVLNVAGNRESVRPGIQDWCETLLRKVFTCLS